MSRNKKRKGKKTNILLGFICIILVGVLGTILVMSYNTEQEEAKRLTELAGNQQSGIEDYEAVKEHAAQLEKASSEDENTEDADNSETKKSKKKEDTAGEEDAEETAQAEDTTEAEAPRTISGVVCWGDDLINGEESNTYSYMAVLQKLLTDNGYNLTVINKTLQGGGTLSMMKMAGVSDETLQGYIAKHQQAANGAQLNVTEISINEGDAPKYYVTDHHVAIIDRHTWNQAQMMLLGGEEARDKKEKKRRANNASPFTNLTYGVDGCNEPMFRIGYNTPLYTYTDERSAKAEP